MLIMSIHKLGRRWSCGVKAVVRGKDRYISHLFIFVLTNNLIGTKTMIPDVCIPNYSIEGQLRELWSVNLLSTTSKIASVLISLTFPNANY